MLFKSFQNTVLVHNIWTKNETIGYDWERYEGFWCVRRECEKSRQVEVQDKGGRPQMVWRRFKYYLEYLKSIPSTVF